jgi:hypothetical protein
VSVGGLKINRLNLGFSTSSLSGLAWVMYLGIDFCQFVVEIEEVEKFFRLKAKRFEKNGFILKSN